MTQKGKIMTKPDNPIKEPCKLFKLVGNDVPDFCERHFTPKVDWQKFCNNKKKCHNEYWRITYQEKKITNKRLERLEKQLGIK